MFHTGVYSPPRAISFSVFCHVNFFFESEEHRINVNDFASRAVSSVSVQKKFWVIKSLRRIRCAFHFFVITTKIELHDNFRPAAIKIFGYKRTGRWLSRNSFENTVVALSSNRDLMLTAGIHPYYLGTRSRIVTQRNVYCRAWEQRWKR